MKTFENLRNKVDVMNQLQPYVGTYYSKEYIRKNILKLSDEEIENINLQNQEEPSESQGEGPGSMQATELSKEVQQ